MLSSLTIIPHRPTHNLLPTSPLSSSPPDNLSSNNATNASNLNRRHASSHYSAHRNPILTALDADEAALHARKTAIRRFGATWLRPPGVPKTYQAMVDEAAERAEQEALARREAAMAAETQAAEEEARRVVRGLDGEDGEEGDEEGMGVDLDEEVPEASGAENEEDGDEEEAERDLDDDVPEAEDGDAWEHTDTEAEESESEEGDMAVEHVDEDEGDGGIEVVQNLDTAGPGLGLIPPPDWGSGGSIRGLGPVERMQELSRGLGLGGNLEGSPVTGNSSVADDGSPSLGTRETRRAQRVARRGRRLG
ncbi:MAG: hypothetical protein Q9159_006284 [Coniocarpon cinnabarinum]